MTWPEFKEKLLALPKSDSPVKVERLGVIIDEEVFLKTHITVVDKYPEIRPRTALNQLHRLIVAKPHYDRLMAYYLLKTQL